MLAGTTQNDKLPWTIKLPVFVASIVSLSWFFAGWRAVNEHPDLSACLLLFAGVLLTVFFVLVQAYWIYFEEKKKGSLKKTIALFEKTHNYIAARRSNSQSHE